MTIAVKGNGSDGIFLKPTAEELKAIERDELSDSSEEFDGTEKGSRFHQDFEEKVKTDHGNICHPCTNTMHEVSKCVSLNANRQAFAEIGDVKNDDFVSVEIDGKHDSKGVEPKKKEIEETGSISRYPDALDDTSDDESKPPDLNWHSSDDESVDEEPKAFKDNWAREAEPGIMCAEVNMTSTKEG